MVCYSKKGAWGVRRTDLGEVMEVQIIDMRSARSTFVNVLAWIFIVIAGSATVISILPNVGIKTMIPLDQIRAAAGPGADQIPPFARFMMEHMQSFIFLFFVVSSAVFIAAIGLIRRKNWARIAFVAILGLAIVWNIACLVVQQLMFSSVPSILPKEPADIHANFHRMISLVRVFTFVFAIGLSALLAWLIKRLLSQSVRAEFM